MMSHPTVKVTVLMSVYNGAQYLREAVDSILTQSFTDFEFIIINDCSTDNTGDILADYGDRDRRIVLLNNETNLGLTKSLNKGLKVARGEYIARQDADDISLPQRIEKQIQVLEKCQKIVLVSCNLELIDSNGNLIKEVYRDCASEMLRWHLIFYNHIGGHSQVVFRRQPVMKLGGYSEPYRYAQDYELWLRLMEVGELVVMPDILLRYRYTHTESISSQFRSKQEEFALQAIRQNISKLINKNINLSEAAALKGFWEQQFPSAQYAGAIHASLSKIYDTFLSQNIDDASKNELSCQIKTLIEERFIRWMRILVKQNQINELCTVSQYALRWNFKKTLNYHLEVIRRRLKSIVNYP